jgi:hypothetical protein
MAPEDRDRLGGLSHDIPCVACGHDHAALPCDHCLCGSAWRPGIDF